MKRGLSTSTERFMKHIQIIIVWLWLNKINIKLCFSIQLQFLLISQIFSSFNLLLPQIVLEDCIVEGVGTSPRSQGAGVGNPTWSQGGGSSSFGLHDVVFEDGGVGLVHVAVGVLKILEKNNVYRTSPKHTIIFLQLQKIYILMISLSIHNCSAGFTFIIWDLDNFNVMSYKTVSQHYL